MDTELVCYPKANDENTLPQGVDEIERVRHRTIGMLQTHVGRTNVALPSVASVVNQFILMHFVLGFIITYKWRYGHIVKNDLQRRHEA